MSSELKSAPVPAGRAHNALRHGLTATSILVPGETQEEYDAHLAAYVQQFQPANGVQHDLVQSMAVARWRLRRVPGIEADMLTREIADHPDDYVDMDNQQQRVARAFESCSKALSLLTRYETALNRTFERAWKQLQMLQSTRPLPPPEELRNEPKPDHSGLPSSPSNRPTTSIIIPSNSTGLGKESPHSDPDSKTAIKSQGTPLS